MIRPRDQKRTVDGLRARALILWAIIAPVVITVLVLAIALRPDRAASSDTNLTGSVEAPSNTSEPSR